jgi:hypothetical protein
LNTALSDGWRQSVRSTFFGIVDHEDDDIHEEDQHQPVDALASGYFQGWADVTEKTSVVREQEQLVEDLAIFVDTRCHNGEDKVGWKNLCDLEEEPLSFHHRYLVYLV